MMLGVGMGEGVLTHMPAFAVPGLDKSGQVSCEALHPVPVLEIW